MPRKYRISIDNWRNGPRAVGPGRFPFPPPAAPSFFARDIAGA